MKIKYWRRISQIIFFILIIYGGVLVAKAFSINKKAPSLGTEGEINLIDATLPIRSCRYTQPKPTLFESCALRYLLDRPLYMGPWLPLLLYVLIIISLCFVFARFMCGWICPFGFISDILDYCRKKFKISRILLPEKLKNFLNLWRYSFLLFLIFLSLAIIIPFAYGIFMNKNFFSVACQTCPVRLVLPFFGWKTVAMPSFFTTATAVFSILSLIFLGIYLTGVIVTRPWCRICFSGAFISLFNKGSLITKEKDVRKCTKCGICKRVCPFNNDHVYKEKKKKNISNTNCIMCFNCIDKCPENGCLKAKFAGITVFKSKFKK